MTTSKATKPKKTSIKIPKGYVMAPTALKVWPGEGALKYAMRYVEEMTIAHVQGLCVDLVAGNIEGIDDKKVRRCQFCGYYYECPTKNNSSLVCSEECKTGKDIALKAFRREVRKADKPKRPTYKDRYYAEYAYPSGEKLEYPFWQSNYHAREYDRKRGAYLHGDDLEDVIAYALLNQKMGGKKKATQTIDYDGDLKAKPIAVNLSEKRRITKEIVIYKSSREEIEAGLLERYGERHLKKERTRCIIFGKYGVL